MARKDFEVAKKPPNKNGLAVYMLVFNHTPGKDRLIEQTENIEKIKEIQKLKGADFPNLALPADGTLSGVVFLISTKEVAEELRKQSYVAVVIPQPEMPFSAFSQQARIAKSITVEPL